MTVAEKFLGRQVWADRDRGKTRGTVIEAKRIWAGNWLLLIRPMDDCCGFWVKSRNCKLV